MMGCLAGKTFLRFIVEKDGSLSQISIIKGVSGCPECDKEAIKVIEQTPKWIPAKNGETTVRTYMNVPVTFKMH